MINSMKEKSQFILCSVKNDKKYCDEKYSEKKYNVEKFDRATIEKLPMMIRTNGLILSLEFLFSKDGSVKNIGKLIVNFIIEFHNMSSEIAILIEELRELTSYKYMYLQKDIYDLSLQFKTLLPILLEEKEGEN